MTYHHSVQSADILLYADNAKCLLQIISSSNARLCLQNDLSILTNWCTVNEMAFNTDKSFVMEFHNEPLDFQYSLSGHTIDIKTCTKDLGVWIENDL